MLERDRAGSTRAFRIQEARGFVPHAGNGERDSTDFRNVRIGAGTKMNEGHSETVEGVESKFRFVHVAARRARQLMGGMPAMLESTSRKPTRIAEEEGLAGLIEYEVTPPVGPQTR